LEKNRTPPRAIGLAGAVLINLNAVIGAGIFALPALLYAGTGSLAPLVILAFAALVAAPLMVIAKLSTLFDQSGGPQLYVERAFGPFAGFQTGWFLIGQNLAARAANFHVLVAYLAALFPLFDDPIIRLGTIIALIALLTGLSVIGTRRSIEALWVGTVFKLGPIVLICLAGLFTNGLPAQFTLPEFSQVESIALLLAYAYSGGTLSAVTAGEVKDSRRTVYRSIVVNLGVIAVFYALVQLAYIAIDPGIVNVDRPLASAGEAVLGQWGIALISMAAIFSTGTNQLSYFVSMPRLLFGMSERGLLPRWLSHVSARFATPSNAIIAYGAIVALLAVSGTFATLATFMVALESLASLLVIAALVKFWHDNENGIAQAMRWWWVVVIAVGAAFTTWLLMQVPAHSALPTLGVLVAGSALYFLARARLPMAPQKRHE